MLEATMNFIKSRALRTMVPLISHMHAWAEGADVLNPCHAQPSARLNEQSVSTKPKTSGACICHSGAAESMAHWTNAGTPAKTCAPHGPFGGRSPEGSMQALPDLMRFVSSMATKAVCMCR